MTRSIDTHVKGFRPPFSALVAKFPRKTISRAELYSEIGIEALVDDPQYSNTCAIRMSYALAQAGVFLAKGGLKINKGAYRNRRIEPSMRKLSNYLVEQWGQPEKYASDAAAMKGIGGRKGVISFFFGETLPLVGAQGHIDLVWPNATGYYQCAGACFFSERNAIWFSPLD